MNNRKNLRSTWSIIRISLIKTIKTQMLTAIDGVKGG